jgi:hypothetical protein
LRTTTATAVETSPLGDDAFSLGGREITESPIGRGIVRALPLDQIPATGYRYWTVDHPPFGFMAARRDLAVTTGEPATGQILRDVAYIDTFVRGSDVIAVEQRDAGYASQTGTTIGTIGAGALGPGRVTVTAQGPALQFAEGASVVTVRGSVDVAHLRAFARLLRPNKVREQ